MRLIFKGAARTVTGSKHLLETDKGNILVDCGLYQGKREEAYNMNKAMDGIDPKAINCIVLTHAHIDHCGAIPLFSKKGFEGDIVCTHATRDLANILLRDSAHIQEADIEYTNKKRAEKLEEPFNPLYTMVDAVKALDYFVSYTYNRPFKILGGVDVKLVDAGHILGSSMAIVKAEGKTILFSGDLGRKNMPILNDPAVITEPIDYLIIESTYGDRLHDNITSMEEELAQVVNTTVKRKGKLVVPAFSVGRTQELVYALNRLLAAKKIPDIPIYVDSPLSVSATSVFRLHAECFDTETHDFLIKDGDPFGFEKLHYISTAQDSKRLNSLPGSCIIISASGMCEAGRIQHHLKNTITEEKNTILFVGFQAENTLGRHIVEGQKEVKIFGELHTVRAEIKKIESFSAHADKNDLKQFIVSLPNKPKQIFVVHGEEPAALSFAAEMEKEGYIVRVPHKDDIFEL